MGGGGLAATQHLVYVLSEPHLDDYHSLYSVIFITPLR